MQERNRAIGCLWGMFVGDALAMPVHWYYDRSRIKQDFGKITQYEAPKASFPESIMNKSSTGGGGRGSTQGSIIGDVICHGKKDFWHSSKGYHYHHGMRAGENTLDTLVCRLLIVSMTQNAGVFSSSKFLQSYATFMTTPNSHNDTYAATAHRMFFANWSKKIPLSQCADNDGHNTDSIDGLINTIPLAVRQALLGGPKVQTFEVINA
jgi:ADP-ribosyl-[dinitrogen reductase] hydrolase